MTKTTVGSEGGINFGKAGLTITQAIPEYGMPGAAQDSLKVAAWNGHEFELFPGFIQDESTWILFKDMWEQSVLVHHPIDPRMTEADVAGATVAYPNADNTGWLFAHCDNDYMRDRESHLVATMTDAFAPMHRQLSRKLQRLELGNIVERLKEPAFEKIELMEEFHVDTEMLSLIHI